MSRAPLRRLDTQVVRINIDLLQFHSIPSVSESSVGGVDLIGSNAAAQANANAIMSKGRIISVIYPYFRRLQVGAWRFLRERLWTNFCFAINWPFPGRRRRIHAHVLRPIRDAAGQTNRPNERSVCNLNPHGRAWAGSSISEYCHSRGVCEGVGFRDQRPFTKRASLVP
jgi:hypothetical protein